MLVNFVKDNKPEKQNTDVARMPILHPRVTTRFWLIYTFFASIYVGVQFFKINLGAFDFAVKVFFLFFFLFLCHDSLVWLAPLGFRLSR
jgi:hypothetical protein